MPTRSTLSKILALATVLAIALCGFFFEDVKEWFPWLTSLQVRSYNWIARREARKPRPQWVVTIEIDDRTYYDYMKLGPEDVTDRSDLGRLLKIAGAYNAAVIGLDINITKDLSDNFEPRKTANAELLKAIKEVEAKHIPVVLTVGFDDPQSSERKPLPNVFANEELPDFGNLGTSYRTRVGFDEAAEDRRAIPLVVVGRQPSGEDSTFSSFPLEVVDAYEAVTGISPRTKDLLSQQILDRRFVYTSFLPQGVFTHLSAVDVLNNHDPTALQQLNHRIVLIGGNRHDPTNIHKWLDNHVLPPLEMRGMYFQANRVEGLLDNRIKVPVDRWKAFWIDLVLGLAILYFYGLARTFIRGLALLAGFFIPVTLTYIMAVNFGYALDFVLPLLLLIAHVFIEHYFHLRHLAKKAKEPLAYA